jgi:hypothetical protein
METKKVRFSCRVLYDYSLNNIKKWGYGYALEVGIASLEKTN